MDAARGCSFVAISDTHNEHLALGRLPDADVLLCGGDFTTRGRLHEINAFVRWLIDEQGHIPQKLIIPGNHELTLGGLCGPEEAAAAREALTNAEARDAGIELLIGSTAVTRVGGFRVFGSPVTPWFWGGFMKREDEIGQEWAKIPRDADIVMTHGPARGHGDAVRGRGFGVQNVGCPALLCEVLDRVRPAVCVAGHIHEGRGVSAEGDVTFLNVSTCNLSRRPVHRPVRFRLERRRTEEEGEDGTAEGAAGSAEATADPASIPSAAARAMSVPVARRPGARLVDLEGYA